MAEWLSTDLFQVAVAATRGISNYSDSYLGPGQSAFPDCAYEINNRAEREQDAKSQTKKKFRGKQLTHEIELQDEENRHSQ